MSDLITITSGALTAQINPLGAELSSLTDADGRELMTAAEPSHWQGRAPILFPIVGRLNGDVLRVDGREYPMKQHGFARRSTFEVVEAGKSRAVFRLEDSAETRAIYPFAFRLEVAFTFEDDRLLIDATIANPGHVPLPSSFGFHPAFAWPLPYGEPREQHEIAFETREDAPIQRLEAGLFAGERPSPLAGRKLALDDALFEKDALVWFHPGSESVTYGARRGPKLDIGFPDTPFLGIWSQPGAGFVCVEPWHGHADPAGFAGEFRDKPGVFEVAPGAEKRVGMSVTLVS